ncbi:Bax inhibitor-1/YccA family protein [Lactobacillus hominis]|uniref:Integral membrane protein n=1 Tax=Lactobacillus hominis DSM 23910 = CRBIP 24.179 TaxID=1423758 RepID=I7LAC7_9LACO|nr:Bax inhibitor-1/YccA family protein [Lactobacillus hominis]KRM84815.1 integral membrane protein [Lactobacillus hominis DSM 23910 = CRBIP 24.179]MCT3347852.1 Bax inhibitor-1/YccA family protein [Lactobacillus hominis]CCI82144.1 Putative uncharacterized protein [Lactobacillus hominis DSM 23910 = CRBIP 24.179]
MNNFSQEPQRTSVNATTGLNSFLTKMYGFMTLAVLISAFVAFIAPYTYLVPMLRLVSQNQIMLYVLFLGVPIVLTLLIGSKSMRSPGLSLFLLMLMAAVYGAEFSILALVFSGQNITYAFVSAAAVFITMAFLGTTTKKDLSNLGSYAFAALIGLVVATLINMFLKNPMVTYVFSYIGVIIFTILTAWDAQKMKNMYLQTEGQVSTTGLAVVGALNLYLDFINIFIYFIQIFAGSDRD